MADDFLTKEEVEKLAVLAKLPLSEKELCEIPKQLSGVLEYMSKIKSLPTEGIEETSQVTGTENVFREDEIEKDRILSQEQVLANAKSTHNGYFKVQAVLEE